MEIEENLSLKALAKTIKEKCAWNTCPGKKSGPGRSVCVTVCGSTAVQFHVKQKKKNINTFSACFSPH